jgi:DNA-nicking Smr family endonuclease
MRSRVEHGRLAIDGRIDLHGLTQAAAHQRLGRFLAEAQAGGARIVLVITGKGKPTGDLPLHEEPRGVLRRVVPQWLAAPEMRRLVIGFEESGRGHGGEGALYVRIRRRGL